MEVAANNRKQPLGVKKQTTWEKKKTQTDLVLTFPCVEYVCRDLATCSSSGGAALSSCGKSVLYINLDLN